MATFKNTVQKFLSQLAVLILCLGYGQHVVATTTVNQEVELGKLLFFNPILSKNNNQSCASCHNAANAFTDNTLNPLSKKIMSVSIGSDGKSLGKRNAPTLHYLIHNPPLQYNTITQAWRGGFFYDGRAETLQHQVTMPIFDKTEMALENTAQLIKRIQQNRLLKNSFQIIYGATIFNNEELFLQKLAQAIRRFLQSAEFALADSKYDRFLRGEYDFSPLEDLGYALFFSINNTNCAACHAINVKEKMRPIETFTDYSYHNIGTPSNLSLKPNKDQGLYENPKISSVAERGKLKVPTLRNVAVTAPYMHNGIFNSLATVIKFYDHYINPNNTINPETKRAWRAPAVKQNINHKLLRQGKKLDKRKIDALVAFLKTITDKKYEYLLETTEN